jgi:hypothetical protein
MALRPVLLALLLATGISALLQPAQACDKHLRGHSGAEATAPQWR